MDWTNSKKDAEGVDHLAHTQKWIGENPTLARMLSAGMGVVDMMSLSTMQDAVKSVSPVRSSYPWEFRAGQYAPIAAVALGTGQIATPLIAPSLIAALRDPATQRALADRVAPTMNRIFGKNAEAPAASNLPEVPTKWPWKD